ncbi:YiaA/YiaB family inner membrane protein [Methylobacterium hispanicum]|uniref:YiaA/YiaB family inner membrane protein n=1 Tax=Methylobacterium hispanicum TaxID=270350 RepID=UPI002F2C95F1
MTHDPSQQHSSNWVSFTYASFAGSVAMVALGIVFMPIDIWLKGYFAMGTVMLIQSCVTMTKTVRDVHESRRMVNRIEDARTERLLMTAGKE